MRGRDGVADTVHAHQLSYNCRAHAVAHPHELPEDAGVTVMICQIYRST